MRTEIGLLAAVAVIAGLGLLASSGPPPQARGGVVLNRAPSAMPGSKLEWATWGPLAAVPRSGAEGRVQAPPTALASAQQPAASEAGIWATPAEFAASD